MRITNVLMVAFGVALGLAASVGFVFMAGEVALLPAVQTIGSIAVMFSALVAFRLYISNIRWHQQDDARKASETYLKESLSLLDKAYEIFVREGTDPPLNDRLLWLSAARMIVRFQTMRQRISEADHIAVADENEEHIRLKFYTILGRNKNNNFTTKYFGPSGTLNDGDNINLKSIAVIFGFAHWKDGTADPLAKIDDVELFARGALPIDQFGAKAYLENDADYWQKVQERMKELNTERIRLDRAKPRSEPFVGQART